MAGEPCAALTEDAREIFGPLPCRALVAAERPLETAAPGESLEIAVNRMWWRQVGALPVVHEGRLVGCFAEEDLLRVLAARLRERAGDESPALVWRELLGDVLVRDAMTPVGKLPVVRRGDGLLEGLRACCAPLAPRGRYLFLVDAHDDGDHVGLASFRDVARLLTALYEDAFDPGLYPDPDAAARAVGACRRLLGVAVGTWRREIGLGHEPNRIDELADGYETVGAMAEQGRGYVLVTLPGGEPIGICTRRDVLAAVRPRWADLGRISLRRMMTTQLMTVADHHTLCGVFHLMASASCRHMPLIDGRDRVATVVSMWDAVALLCGEPPPPAP